MEIQLEKLLQDLAIEVYMKRRLEEENVLLKTKIKKLEEEKETLQKVMKKEIEDV